MKIFISYLIQIPMYYVLLNGLVALTGINIWWCLPIYVAIGLSYAIGEMMRRGDL